MKITDRDLAVALASAPLSAQEGALLGQLARTTTTLAALDDERRVLVERLRSTGVAWRTIAAVAGIRLETARVRWSKVSGD